MSGARRTGAAAAVRERNPGSYGVMRYGQLLKTMDGKIDQLAHVGEPIARLRQGAELILALYGFSLELEGRCLALRGVLEFEARME